MASIQSKIVYRILRILKYKYKLEKELTTKADTLGQRVEPNKRMIRSLSIEMNQCLERDVYTISPKQTPSTTVLLYLHGGAFVQNFINIHWKFIHKMVSQTHCTVIAPDYPLATHKETYAMLMQLYDEILLKHEPKQLILIGDSAGANLALGLSQRLVQNTQNSSPKMILLSPWLDLTLTDPDIQTRDALDPILNIHALKIAGSMFAGTEGTDHPLVSPLYGNLENLGEISIFTGTYDFLNSDAKRLYQKTRLINPNNQLFEYEGMIHDWMLFSFPESKETIKQIIEQISK